MPRIPTLNDGRTPRVTGALTPREPRWLWLLMLFLAGGPLNPVAWMLVDVLSANQAFHSWIILMATSVGTAVAVGFLYARPRNLRSILWLAARSAGLGWMFALVAYIVVFTIDQFARTGAPDTTSSALSMAAGSTLLMIPALLISLPIAISVGLLPALGWGVVARFLAFRRQPNTDVDVPTSHKLRHRGQVV